MNNSLSAIDSNIFIYALNDQSEHHTQAKTLLAKVPDFCIATQNIMEIYNVITDPKKFPNALDPKSATKIIISIVENEHCHYLHPSPFVWEDTLKLAENFDIKGKQLVYDCYLAATLRENRIEVLYTTNLEDFKKFPFIKAINPFV